MHLILDFDSTLTTRDTIAPLTDISKIPPDQRDVLWTSLSEAYMRDLKAHKETYKPPTGLTSQVEIERAYLASLGPIEAASIQRVEGSGLFSGFNCKRMSTAAFRAIRDSTVSLRLGWEDLFRLFMRSGTRLQILSVNWSTQWIRQVLLDSAARSSTIQQGSDGVSFVRFLSAVRIEANELEGLWSQLDEGGTTGLISSHVPAEQRYHTSADKVRGMRRLIEERAAQKERLRTAKEDEDDDEDDWVLVGEKDGNVQSKEKVVYVGDSATDFECLLEADVGICMRDATMGGSQRELAKMLSRCDVQVKDVDSDGVAVKGKKLLSTTDFVAVTRVLEKEMKGQSVVD